MADRTFGDYQLIRPLGRGGMGVVYEAVQLSLGRHVALKMILDAEGASPAALRRFTVEAETVARLDHPNIVPLYQFGEVNGQPFLSMKLIAGETLRKKIADGVLALEAHGAPVGRDELRAKLHRIVDLLLKVTDAVEHAHEHGVLHRDLKPGNILVDDAGQPHLLDFGLAKILQRESDGVDRAPTEENAPLGTPSYMSPEQAEGRRLTPASDIHGLGAILYEMLCGTPPFAAATPLEMLRRVIEERPAAPRAVNPRIVKDLETICLKCLEKSAAARYPSARALAQDLARWQRHEPIHARPAGVPLRLGRWVARNRLGSALIASLCLGLGLTLLSLQQTLDRQKKLDIRRANSLQAVNADIEEMWKDPQRPFLKIRSATLADYADLPPRLNDPRNPRLVFANAINDEPFGQALQYASFLNEIEARLQKRLSRSVLIDLNLYKSENDALRDLRRGMVQIQRMAPVEYVLGKRAEPGLLPLVRERGQQYAVIFATGSSGITNLAQLKGHRLVLGQATSDSAFWGKVYLARSSITANCLRSCIYMRGGMGESAASAPEAQMADRDPGLQAHRRVIQEVLRGAADAGIAPRRHFDLAKHRKSGLVELFTFPVSNEVFIGSPALSAEMARALQDTLVSFDSKHDKALARLANNSSCDGFEKIEEREFAPIRAALEKEIAEFEGSAQ